MAESVKGSVRANPNGDWPEIASTAYVDPSAQVIGNVYIGPEVFIGPNTTIRADETDGEGMVLPIRIEARCNVQDGVIVHALGGTGVTIGQRTSLAHGCIIHGGCRVGSGCFIGFGAVVFDVTLGDGVFIGTRAVIERVDLGANAFVPPAVSVLSKEDVTRLVSTTGREDRDFMVKVINTNVALTQGYLRLER